MTTPGWSSPSLPRPRVGSTSSYTELARQIRQSGLLGRRYAYYWTRIVAAVVVFVAILVGVVLLGDTWWQLVLAAAFGVLLTQFGFLGHDAAHRQIFVSPAWNEWTARVLSGAFAGLSYSWWRDKHHRHHAAPNQEGRDPDIAPGVLALTADIAEARTTGLQGWFTAHQGWLFVPLLVFEGLNLHVAGLRVLAGRDPVRHRASETAIVVTRLAAYVALLLLVLPPGKAAAFLAVQLGVFGLCLGGSFAPNHVGMPIVPHASRIDFLQRQVLMSRNVRGGFLVEAAMGGLNHQIEHHLFPSMPRPNLRLAQPVVRQYCAEIGVPYTEESVARSFAIVIGYLNHVGLRASRPFECPLAGELR